MHSDERTHARKHTHMYYYFPFLPSFQIGCVWGLILTVLLWAHTQAPSLSYTYTHIYMHKHSSVQLVDPFHITKVKGILSNLSSLISPLTHVYQRRDPCCYLGNQTGSVGGQGFQVLLLSSLCFPLVALQEQTQQQQRLITRWCERLKWPCGPHWLMWMRFWESWCDCVTRRCTPWWKAYQMHSLPSYQVREIWPSAWCLRIWK